MKYPQELLGDQEELKSLFQSFIEASERMEQQHRLLTEEITSLKASNAQKDRQLQRRSRLESLGQMAAGVAHEIRNPLGGIRLYADLLLRRLDKNSLSWESETVTKIRHHILQLEQVVSDMLDFTKEVTLRRCKSQIDWVMNRALELAQGHESASRHQVNVNMLPATLCIDTDQLQRAFLNIILNAFQAMEEKGELVIKGHESQEKGYYEITISDTGPGIPEEMLDKIFNPFTTTKAEGTGLGLAITYRILEEHHGSLEVRNGLHRGVVVTILLPFETKAQVSSSMRTASMAF